MKTEGQTKEGTAVSTHNGKCGDCPERVQCLAASIEAKDEVRRLRREGLCGRGRREMIPADPVFDLLGQFGNRTLRLQNVARRVLLRRDLNPIRDEQEIAGVLDMIGSLMGDLYRTSKIVLEGEVPPVDEGYVEDGCSLLSREDIIAGAEEYGRACDRAKKAARAECRARKTA